jgi:hypothetical protein
LIVVRSRLATGRGAHRKRSYSAGVRVVFRLFGGCD